MICNFIYRIIFAIKENLNFKPVRLVAFCPDISEPCLIRCGSIKNQVQPFDTFKMNKDKNINR